MKWVTRKFYPSTRSNPRLFTFGSTSINLEFYRKNNTNAYLRVITKMLYPMTDQERAELETLRQEVEKQKILVEAYELMLELARERLHVDVKKNYEEMLLAGLSRDRKNGEVKP